MVTKVITSQLREMRSGVVPEDVKTANRAEHMHMLDAQILGSLVSRAATEGVASEEFNAFLRRYLRVLQKLSHTHVISIDERIAKAKRKYQFY